MITATTIGTILVVLLGLFILFAIIAAISAMLKALSYMMSVIFSPVGILLMIFAATLFLITARK